MNNDNNEFQSYCNQGGSQQNIETQNQQFQNEHFAQPSKSENPDQNIGIGDSSFGDYNRNYPQVQKYPPVSRDFQNFRENENVPMKSEPQEDLSVVGNEILARFAKKYDLDVKGMQRKNPWGNYRKLK